MAIDKKLREIIYNVKERDAHSVGVKDGEYLERGQCQYVFGGPEQSDWFYCGHKTIKAGTPYCEEHYALCYRGTKAKKNLKELLPS